MNTCDATCVTSICFFAGNHTFDREKNGGRFYCTQHFGLTETIKPGVDKKRILMNKENLPNAAKLGPDEVHNIILYIDRSDIIYVLNYCTSFLKIYLLNIFCVIYYMRNEIKIHYAIL